MSVVLNPITLNAGVTIQQSLDNPIQMSAIIIANKSSFDIIYDGFGTRGARWLTAGTEIMIPANNDNRGYLSLTPVNTALLNPVPQSIAIITEYFVDEDLPQGSWPVSIPTQVVQSNAVTTQANQLKNDGTAAGFALIESTVSGDTSPAVSITNDGKVQFGSTTFNNLADFRLTIGSITGTPTSPGTGSTILWMDMRGTLKRVFALQTNFKNSGTGPVNIVLPVAFTNGARIESIGVAGYSLNLSGVAQTLTLLPNYNASTATGTAMNTNLAFCLSGFDTLSIPNGNASTHNGYIIIEGV